MNSSMIVSECSKSESNSYDTLGVKWSKTHNLTIFSILMGGGLLGRS